jgi:hypothetical protein
MTSRRARPRCTLVVVRFLVLTAAPHGISRAMKNALACALLLVACGKSDSKKTAAAPPAPKLDIAGVNALVPAELKDKLVFEQRDIVEERGKGVATFTLAAPKGWEQSNKMFAKVKPPSGASDLGFMTSFGVGSNCDGTCEPKDWAKTSEKVEFAQFRDGKIVKDELGKTSHLMIAEKGGTTYVVYAWWQDGARKYASCTASLEAPVAAAAPAPAAARRRSA